MADETGSPEDQQAVGELMMKLAGAFRSLDATGVEDLYSEDADWTNAFGTSKKGAAEIAAYLAGLFADEHFGAGKPVGPPQASMRFVTDDVCVVKTYLEREGQETSGGETAGGAPKPFAQGVPPRSRRLEDRLRHLHGRPRRRDLRRRWLNGPDRAARLMQEPRGRAKRTRGAEPPLREDGGGEHSSRSRTSTTPTFRITSPIPLGPRSGFALRSRGADRLHAGVPGELGRLAGRGARHSTPSATPSWSMSGAPPSAGRAGCRSRTSPIQSSNLSRRDGDPARGVPRPGRGDRRRDSRLATCDAALARLYEGWGAGDLSDGSLFDGDIVGVFPDPFASPHYGAEAIGEYMRRLLESWTGLRLAASRYQARRESFVVDVRRSGVGKESGRGR